MPNFNPDSQIRNNVVQSLINVTSSAEGTSLPPRQIGEFRIPFVTNLRVGPSVSYLGGTEYTLIWDAPDDTTNVSHYNVYVKGALRNNQALQFASSANSSPATFRVTASQATTLTFYVQTQLNNGNVSEIARSPSCTSQAVVPLIQISDVVTYPGFFGLCMGRGSVIVSSLASATMSDGDTYAIVSTPVFGVNQTIYTPPNPRDAQLLIIANADTHGRTVTPSPNTGQTMSTVAALSSPGAYMFIYSTTLSMWVVVGKV